MTPKELQQKVADLPSYILDDDFIIYHRYLPLMKDDIIDVGTGWGKSAMSMAILNPKIKVFTLDDGSYPIYQRWAADQTKYKERLEEEFEKHGIKNIILEVCDLDSAPTEFNIEKGWSLIHIDLTKEKEIDALKVWLPRVAINGLALIRNFERLHESLGDLLEDFEYIDKGGLIHVYRRFK